MSLVVKAIGITEPISKMNFQNKTLLITGGTGSFGNAVLKRFLDTDISEIRIFSRDEKKQDDMRKRYNNAKLKFYIGDVRDSRSVDQAMRGVDYVFHAAALKQVPSHEALLCIQTQATLDDPKHMRFQTNEFYFRPPEEMKEVFKDYPS